MVDFTSVEFLIGLVGGAVIGMSVAVSIGRSHFAEMQDTAREAYRDVQRELFSALDLIEGQAQELYDAANKRITRSTKK